MSTAGSRAAEQQSMAAGHAGSATALVRRAVASLYTCRPSPHCCLLLLPQVHIPEGLTALDLDVIKLTVRWAAAEAGGAQTGRLWNAVDFCIRRWCYSALSPAPPAARAGPVCGAQRQVVPDGPGLPRARQPAGVLGLCPRHAAAGHAEMPVLQAVGRSLTSKLLSLLALCRSLLCSLHAAWPRLLLHVPLPQFNFLKPTHSLFGFFTALCDAYSRVLMPPKELRARLDKDASDRCARWCGARRWCRCSSSRRWRQVRHQHVPGNLLCGCSVLL